MDGAALQILSLYYQGVQVHDIALSVRKNTEEVKRILKSNRVQAQVHFSNFGKDRYQRNAQFSASLQVASALEPFAGNRRQYPGSVTNDLFVKGRDYNMDANEFMQLMLRQHGEASFDLVDIDPMGCSVNFFENGLKLSRRGVIVFVGDLSFFKRFKHNISTHYVGMDPEDYGIEAVARWYTTFAYNQGRAIRLVDTLLYPHSAAAKLYFKIEQPATRQNDEDDEDDDEYLI